MMQNRLAIPNICINSNGNGLMLGKLPSACIVIVCP